MIQSCSTSNFDHKKYLDIWASLSKAKEMGFSHIDLIMFEGWQNINPSDLKKCKVNLSDDLNRFLIAQEMKITSINARFSNDLICSDISGYIQYQKDFEEVLDFAQRIQVKHVTIQPGPRAKSEEKEGKISLLKDRLTDLGKRARAAGITLAVEGHFESLLENPDDLYAAIIDLYPSVSVTYDSSHFVMQNIPLEDTFKLLEITTHVHVRDAAIGAMQATLETGATNFIALFDELRRINYKGNIAIEYFDDFDSNLTNTLELSKLISNYSKNEEIHV